MRRQHPNHKMDIPVSLEVWNQLNRASLDTGFQKEDWEIAAEAIDEWVRRHKPDAIGMPHVHGYQWKSVFLPDGTLLRTVFGGKNHHCLVEGDSILCNGQAASPSSFANAVGGIRRNAWRCIWILLPDSKEWKLADTLRTRQRPRRARAPARDIQPPPATQPAPARVPLTVPPEAGPQAPQSVFTAASVPEASHMQHARHNQVPRTSPRAERGNQPHSSGMMPPPPEWVHLTERRMNREDPMLALLRQELLPLLHRMSAYDRALTVHGPRA